MEKIETKRKLNSQAGKCKSHSDEDVLIAPCSYSLLLYFLAQYFTDAFNKDFKCLYNNQ